MNKIELYWTPQGWAADFVGDREIRRSFGTTLIPTAFTARAKADVVLAAIERLNPAAMVEVRTPPHQLLALGLN
mgnify:CR=1 FL=1